MSISEKTLVSQHEWESKRTPKDRICLRNLGVRGEFGLDVWSRRKSQPLTISVSVSLNEQFQSAAQRDIIDDSTIHYGKLSKNILSRLDIQTEWLGSHALAEVLEHVTNRTAVREKLIDTLEIDICYPKASMLGEGAGFVYSASYRTLVEVSHMLYLKNVRIPTLIGVNSHERTKKQLVVINLWIDQIATEAADGYVEVEAILTESTSSATFDTLEALATKAAADIMKSFVQPKTPGANIRLRVEKPVAVPLADAPVIEIYRHYKSEGA